MATGLVAVVAIYFFLTGDGNENTARQQTSEQNIVSTVKNTDATKNLEVSEPGQPSPPRDKPKEKDRPGSSEKNVSSKIEKPTITPDYLCRNESNFISRNNCLWRECENPKFSSFPECEFRTNEKNPYEKEHIGIDVRAPIQK